MKVVKFLQPYLASYDLSKLNVDSDGVRKEIITQVLNLGDKRAVEWVFQKYDMDQIKKVLASPNRGLWFKESLNFWQKILDVKAMISHNKNALLTNP